MPPLPRTSSILRVRRAPRRRAARQARSPACRWRRAVPPQAGVAQPVTRPGPSSARRRAARRHPALAPGSSAGDSPRPGPSDPQGRIVLSARGPGPSLKREAQAVERFSADSRTRPRLPDDSPSAIAGREVSARSRRATRPRRSRRARSASGRHPEVRGHRQLGRCAPLRLPRLRFEKRADANSAVAAAGRCMPVPPPIRRSTAMRRAVSSSPSRAGAPAPRRACRGLPRSPPPIYPSARKSASPFRSAASRSASGPSARWRGNRSRMARERGEGPGLPRSVARDEGRGETRLPGASGSTLAGKIAGTAHVGHDTRPWRTKRNPKKWRVRSLHPPHGLGQPAVAVGRTAPSPSSVHRIERHGTWSRGPRRFLPRPDG